MNWISYCLYGNDPRYCIGMVENARLAPQVFPGWKVIVHAGEEVDHPIIEALKNHGVDVRMETGPFGPYRKIWRLKPLEWIGPGDAVIFRDADSRLLKRDCQCVQEWLESDFPFHIIRDNPAHHGVLGGMWGMKGWNAVSFSMDDFAVCLWPFYLHDYPHDSRFVTDLLSGKSPLSLEHDSCTGFRRSTSRPFPVTWQDWPKFVGQIWDVDPQGNQTPRETNLEYQARGHYLYRELIRRNHEEGLTMLNRWNYQGLGRVSYGHPESYTKAAQWFDEVGGTLEDWGCGCAAMRDYVKKCHYLGLEGSKNDFADRCDVDLRHWKSRPDCVLLRDVLDHNVEWRLVLANALDSFQKRMVIVIFRPMGDETKIVWVNTDAKYPGVPDFQFNHEDIMAMIQPYFVKEENVLGETMFYLEKK